MNTLVTLVCIFSTIHVVTGQGTCEVDITQGQNWTVGSDFYNYYAYNVSLKGNFSAIPPPWNVSLFSSQPEGIQATYNFDYDKGYGSAAGYWESLIYNQLPVELGAVVSSSGSMPSPPGLNVAGINCAVNATFNASTPESQIQSGTQPVSVEGTQLLGVDGEPLVLKGINWFGFEEPGNSMVDGLWQVNLPYSCDNCCSYDIDTMHCRAKTA